MLRSGVNKGCGCARLRRLPSPGTAEGWQPHLHQQRRRFRRLMGAGSGQQPPPSLPSVAAGGAGAPMSHSLLGPLQARMQQPRRGLAAAARRVLGKATAANAASIPATGAEGGSATGKKAGGGGGREATPTRRRVSRSMQAQAHAQEAALRGEQQPPSASGGVAAGMMEGSGRVATEEQRQLTALLEDSYTRYDELVNAWEGAMEEEFLKAAASSSATGAGASSGPGPLSKAHHAQHERMLFDPSVATTLPPASSFVIPNDRLEDGGGVQTTWERLVRLEEEMERGTVLEALAEYKEVQETLFRTGKAANLPVVKRQIFAWYAPMIDAMESLHQRLREGRWADLGNGVGTYGPFLALVPPEKLAVLTIHEVVNMVLKFGNAGVPVPTLLMAVAEAVRTEVNYLRLTERYGDRVLASLRENGQLSLKRVNRKAKEALSDGMWPPDLKAKVGGMLLNELHRVATLSEEERGESVLQGAAEAVVANARPAFRVELEGVKGVKRRGLLYMDARFFGRMVAEDDAELTQFLTPRYRPMVVEPRRWDSYDSGGYLNLKTYVVRTQNSRTQAEALKRARMPEVYGALNFLGGVKWRINHEVLDVIQEAYARGLTIGDLPSKTDLVLPPLPSPASTHPTAASTAIEEEEDVDGARAGGKLREQWRERQQLQQRVKKRNAELFSLRCDVEIKLRIAEEFRGHEFFFPYNLDFRGRAYPVPPNLNHLGSDLCRGMLAFAERKPLGPEGLDWLKIHLANLCGKDKFSFADRIAYVDSMLPQARDSAASPLDGQGWWMKAEEPFQALAVCKEITAALDSGNPAAYASGVPVHMDGSCNGLQHYAALGRDEEGARQVNLIGSPQPQDVYTGVCERVIQHVRAEARRRLGRGASEAERRNQRFARLVDGMINRKVVKQTVMTSVYGVTYIGARKQIQARLKERFQERNGGRMLSKEEEQDVYEASRYVAAVTLSKLAELFSSARDIMEWLAACSFLVAKQGQPMSWITPLGLPVVQPYRRETGMLVKTLIQSVVLVDCSDKLPVSSARQRSAFPPNFVHSLDSTHMLMTANRLKELHMPFTAVHDSYWCHAANVPQMNATLRECFVDLYRRPILEDLHASLQARFPDVAFPPVPARGTLRLEEVKDSPYFFD